MEDFFAEATRVPRGVSEDGIAPGQCANHIASVMKGSSRQPERCEEALNAIYAFSSRSIRRSGQSHISATATYSACASQGAKNAATIAIRYRTAESLPL